ncbi:hypothetical protein [Aestuariibacter salexigens]|uniref:hypothetical protein n=1 Tax=Aestuariibacter salexigens TaxID=226010 RepID=UPI000406FE23|nr:hypothetical protein [Aestuariibacter salexigens]
MNIQELATWTNRLDEASDEILLGLRLVLDEPDPVASIEQDLQDLFTYPERLQESYRHEWVAYVKRALAEELSSEQLNDRHILEAFLQTRLHEREMWINRVMDSGIRAIAKTTALLSSDNVTRLPNAHRQAVERMVE